MLEIITSPTSITIAIITFIFGRFLINMIRYAKTPPKKGFKLFKVTDEDGDLIEYRIQKLHFSIIRGLYWSETFYNGNGEKRHYGSSSSLKAIQGTLEHLIEQEKKSRTKEIYTDVTPTERTELPID